MAEKGLIHIYYGGGKGKTTAAAGLALRAAGRGLKVWFVQFLKSSDSGEITELRSLPGVTVLRGKGTCKFASAMDDSERENARNIHDEHLACAVKAARAGECSLLVLDEVIDAYTLGLLEPEPLLELLRDKPPELELVLTGHSLPEELAEHADYITEMRKLRHPYDSGVAAREGVEY